jgi:GTP cyclohydrolase II
VVTARRARTLGLDATGPVGLAIGDIDHAAVAALAAEARWERRLDPVPARPICAAAIMLAKLAHRLPALLIGDLAGPALSCEPPLVSVSAAAIGQLRRSLAASLAIASEANIPLHAGVTGRFVIFRDAVGGNAVAIVVGKPDFGRPVPVRVHSACLTGDVFGSRRCDCGDQLRLALNRLEEQGGGVILYLEQEGRGLGLANKMRTYRLQETGLDTVDANTTLGFDDDERDYAMAARMLEILGCTRVLLLTNNPAKLDGLAEAGIDIAGRIPLHVPSNPDNRRYLTAKATRAGHQLDHLLMAMADPPHGGGRSL